MKKYKLIKEYPGSPSLNTEILKCTVYRNKNHYEVFMIKGENWFELKDPENYSEFWKEIPEKDYEILTLQSNISTKPIITFDDEEYLENKIWNIHSVKRLSDGEVFTIGDKIQLDNNNKEYGTITELYVSHEQLRFYCGNLGGVLCHDIDKRNNFTKFIPKQPLFTTEDGVDIFENDYCYFVRNNFSPIEKPFHCTKEFWSGNLKFYKWFSTKEAAEEYILMNKPCLSLKDIKENTTIKGLSLKKLEKLVQEKLNK